MDLVSWGEELASQLTSPSGDWRRWAPRSLSRPWDVPAIGSGSLLSAGSRQGAALDKAGTGGGGARAIAVLTSPRYIISRMAGCYGAFRPGLMIQPAPITINE